MSLDDCDRVLDERRRCGDLHPDRVAEELERFFDSIKHLSVDNFDGKTL